MTHIRGVQSIHHSPKKEEKNAVYTTPAQTNCASGSEKAVVSFFLTGQLTKDNLVNVSFLFFKV